MTEDPMWPQFAAALGLDPGDGDDRVLTLSVREMRQAVRRGIRDGVRLYAARQRGTTTVEWDDPEDDEGDEDEQWAGYARMLGLREGA